MMTADEHATLLQHLLAAHAISDDRNLTDKIEGAIDRLTELAQDEDDGR